MEEYDVKKIFIPCLLTTLMSTTVLGGAVFAADTDTNKQTPIAADLTLPDDGDTPIVPDPDPTPDPDPNPDPNPDPETPVEPQRGRGIVYYPGAKSISATLNENGEQTLHLYNQIRVGVKDKTRETTPWKLSASLNWGDIDTNGNKYLSTATVKGLNGQVRENKDGVLSAINDGEVTSTANNLEIGTTQTEIMTGVEDKTKNGIYDYSADHVDLVIPDVSKVPAGSYSGTIDWNLSTTP